MINMDQFYHILGLQVTKDRVPKPFGLKTKYTETKNWTWEAGVSVHHGFSENVPVIIEASFRTPLQWKVYSTKIHAQTV